ncbi:MAG: PAS domain S-box protein [Burkholderiaceae bacterium]|nr:PAS domain S-box protein [Burkholderiaceae bacterium]
MNARDPSPVNGSPGWGAAAQAMYRAAQAVSRPGGEGVLAQLVRELADILGVATAFVAVFIDASRSEMRTLAVVLDGQPVGGFDYALEGSPCAQVVGHAYRHIASGVSAEFRPGTVFVARGMDSYAAFPLFDSSDAPLGLLVAMDRRPIADAALAEALLKIFAGRIVAEIEQRRTDEALRRSEASYRAIFESAEDAIFVHDWDTGAVLDANPTACSTYGYSREELRRISLGDVSSGVAPYTGEQALRYIEQAKQGLEPVFEWHRRNKDGSLHWDEVRLKIVRIDGKPHVLAFTREITQRKEADALLRASEEQYHAIFDASADPLILWDSQYRRVDVNPAYERVFGWTRDEVVGRGWDRPEDDGAYAQPRRDLVRRALAGESCSAELCSRRKDGTVIDIEVYATPFRHRGEPHVLAIARDVTERRHAEQRLRAREEQYRAIFDGSVDPMVLWSHTLHVVDVNAAFEQTTGLRRDQVVGRHWSERPDADEMKRLLPSIERALAGEMAHRVEAVTRADGSAFDIELRYLPVRLGNEPFALGIGRDVSERLEGERRLRASEEQYRAIFNASADALVLRDAAYQAVDVNPAYLTMSGFTRDEVLAAPGVLTQSDDAVRSAHRALHDRAVAGETLHFEVQGLRKDGTRFDAEVRGVSVLYRGAPHVLYATRDITERRAAEAEREKLAAQLRQAQKMEAIGQLTGGIAHDFNNILTAVIGYLVLGQERAAAGNDAKLVRQLESAHLAAQRARDLIAQMLTFARGKGGDHRALAPGPLARQSLQLLRSTLPSSVLLEASIRDEALPAILADAVQFEQVLFNLCINARDAMSGSGNIRVDLAVVHHPGLRCTSCGANVGHGPWVELGVADSGSGIAPEVIERMFEPFFSTKATGRGSGMGLAMVHGIVHNHGGHVVVTSEPGHGARFGVLWPPAGTVAEADAPAPSTAKAPGRQLAGRVVLVEDEPQVGAMMAELLTGWGLQVVSMTDPLAARDWLLEPANIVDLLITDHTMPQMTGLQLAQHATQARPALPVLLYTGDPETHEAAVLQRHGVRALLRKPIETQALRAQLQRWLPAG